MGHNHSKETCPTVDESGPDIVPLVGNLTFHTLSIIIAGAAAALSCLVALFLIILHATHFSNPAEQKQILRIITIVPSFALISLILVVLDGSASPYLLGSLDVAEAFPMAAFFLLMSSYVVPPSSTREEFFSELELLDKKNTPQGQGSLAWYKKLSFGVLQWIPVSILTWIATVIALAAGTYCATSNKPHFAHIWITLIRMFSTAFAISSILRFYARSKPILKSRGTMKQLICFKILVFLNFVQTFVFNFLRSGGHLHASDHLSFNDLSNGIPSLILGCEVALLSPYFIYAYSYKPYVIRSSSPTGYLGSARAILSALNIVDIITGMAQGIRGRLDGNGGGGRRAPDWAGRGDY